jgi:ABC-2 type transport system permease protein
VTPRAFRRTLAALFLRDLSITRSYRAAFAMEIVETLLGVALFYFLSTFVHSEELAESLPQETNYFAFAVVGIAFFDYLTVSMAAFENSLQEARQNGVLEPLLVSQTPLSLLVLGSAVYPYVLLSLRTVVYLGWAVLIFDFPVANANWLGAALLLGGSILAFAGLGILSASYLMLYKRGNPVRWFFLGVSGVIGGILYPVAVLPEWLQTLARFVPVTYSLEGMRAALLGGAGMAELWPSLRALLLFGAVLLPVSLAVFAWAVRRTKVIGTLTHF